MEFKNLCQLSDITKMIKRGITPKYAEKSNIQVINQRCIRDGIIYHEPIKFHDECKKIGEEKILQNYDVLVNSTGVGTLGRVSQFFDNSDKVFTADSHVTILRANDNIDKLYFGYAIKEKEAFITSMGEGSTGQTELSRIRLGEEVLINIPERKTQQRIASILSNLDSKIEINNKIISNLESQAQAIFKSWFVDFEPFQDGNFVESELGMIPEGWEVKELGELFKFVKGKKPKDLREKYEDNFIPYIVKGVMDGSETPKFTNEINIVKIKKLDCFMLMDGANSGNIYYGYDGALGSTFGLIEAKNQIYRELIYWQLKTNESIIKNQNTGSAIPHANKDFISKMNVAIPINIEENEILKTLENFRIKINSLNNQNTKLAELRDALLPKLMAGEIDVSNIKIEGEEVKNE